MHDECSAVREGLSGGACALTGNQGRPGRHHYCRMGTCGWVQHKSEHLKRAGWVRAAVLARVIERVSAHRQKGDVNSFERVDGHLLTGAARGK